MSRGDMDPKQVAVVILLEKFCNGEYTVTVDDWNAYMAKYPNSSLQTKSVKNGILFKNQHGEPEGPVFAGLVLPQGGGVN
jgi:hypothetical protein